MQCCHGTSIPSSEALYGATPSPVLVREAFVLQLRGYRGHQLVCVVHSKWYDVETIWEGSAGWGREISIPGSPESPQSRTVLASNHLMDITGHSCIH
jgi:hypothetical protein